MSFSALTEICLGKKELQGLPIIANVDFGHTSPIITFPIGGQVHMDTTDLKPYLSLSW
jgi:muramoyltetrapeptide carboxypeptidase LdcA involved in peptidoglycan recycling